MPRAAVEDNNRVALRIHSDDKATIMRAVAIAQTDMTAFILRAALREAQSIIEENQRLKLSGRDSRLVMELLENPPPPNAKLRKAARALSQDSEPKRPRACRSGGKSRSPKSTIVPLWIAESRH